MFDVGFTELFLLALIGLLVLGPERLPRVARTIGGYVRKARASWISLRNTIEMELAEADIAEPIKKASEEIKQIGKDLTDIPDLATEKLQANTPESESGIDTDNSPDTQQDPNSSKDENA